MGLWQLNLKSHSIASSASLYTVCWVHSRVVYTADDSRVSIFSFRLASFQAVLKNGVISGSGFMNSGNVRCGSSVCRPISGVFAKNPLPNGYVHVTTIPAGASNVTITELRNSINFLGELFRLFFAQRKLLANEEIEKYLQARLSEKQFHQFNLISPPALRANIDTRVPAGLKVNNLME